MCWRLLLEWGWEEWRKNLRINSEVSSFSHPNVSDGHLNFILRLLCNSLGVADRKWKVACFMLNHWSEGKKELLPGQLVNELVPAGSRCRTTFPGCNNSFQSRLSIHPHLSNTVKNPCSRTNWHSSAVHCEETITGMDHWEDNPTSFSHPKAKEEAGMGFDWSGNKWSRFSLPHSE